MRFLGLCCPRTRRNLPSADLPIRPSAVLGQFYLQFPGLHSVGDVGFVMGGIVGREIIGWSYFVRSCADLSSLLLLLPVRR